MANHELSPAQEAIIKEEERLAWQVHEAILRAANARRAQDTAAERFLSLREEVGEANSDDIAGIVTQMELIRGQVSTAQIRELPDSRVPYFAHLRLRDNQGSRDVLLGYTTFIQSREGVRIVDWRTAPIAKVFYQYRVGDEVEIQLPGGLRQGRVEVRRVLSFADGVLVGIDGVDGSFRCVDNLWQVIEGRQAPNLAGAKGGRRAAQLVEIGVSGQRLPAITALLDQEQYAALEAEEDSPLLLLGGAGCGKTTVALHRLALLHGRDPHRYPQEKIAVIVPEEGLVRLTRLLLAELGLNKILVSTFDSWIRDQAKKVFKGLPKTLCESPPYRVMVFKRHLALRRVLPEVVEEMGQKLVAELDRSLYLGGEAIEIWQDLAPQKSLWARLRQLERKLKKGRDSQSKRGIFDACRRAREGLFNPKADRSAILRDRAVLRRAVLLSGGDLSASDVEQVLSHTSRQLATSEAQRYAGFDKDRLRTLDGRSLDEGTPDEIIGTIDVEDYALLLEMQRLKTGAPKKLSSYMHLVVDEAPRPGPS